MTKHLEGLVEADAMLGRIPQAAREELAVETGIIGHDLLEMQRADAPFLTGNLRSGLSLAVILEQLRAKVGLLRMKQGRSSWFYGRIIEFGRAAQTVTVTRRLKRRIVGNGKTSRRRAIYEGKPYKMKVKAMAPRPFVLKPRPDLAADRRLADYWSKVLARAGAE